MKKYIFEFDLILLRAMQKYGISLLRISLAVVFVWFGLLKVIDASPVASLIYNTYPTFPEPLFIRFLGAWEIVVGVGLLGKLFLRATLALLWLQMAGIFFGFFLSPILYIVHGNPLFLSTDGEFVIKNLVLVAASLVIGGKEVKKVKKS